MKWTIQFQYKPEGSSRPYDEVQDDPLEFDHEHFCPLPGVGDTVDYQDDDKIVARKVISRHFSFSHPGSAWVNLVVTDVSLEEMAARVNE